MSLPTLNCPTARAGGSGIHTEEGPLRCPRADRHPSARLQAAFSLGLAGLRKLPPAFPSPTAGGPHQSAGAVPGQGCFVTTDSRNREREGESDESLRKGRKTRPRGDLEEQEHTHTCRPLSLEKPALLKRPPRGEGGRGSRRRQGSSLPSSLARIQTLGAPARSHCGVGTGAGRAGHQCIPCAPAPLSQLRLSTA